MRIRKAIPKEPGALRKIFSSLYSRNYRLYFIGQGISLIGTWMQNVALSWLVYRITGSVFLLGLIGFLSQIPAFVLAPITGVITDRYSRHRIMVFTQVAFLVQALGMAILVLLNIVDVWHIVVLSLVFGIISAFDSPARQSLVIDLIENPKDLGNAIGLNSAIFNGARLFGPAIAGITIALVGEGVCFLLNSLSFFAVIGALVMMKMPVRQKNSKVSNLKDSFTEGLNYTFQSVPIRTLLIILAVLSLICYPFTVLLPAYAKEILKGSSDTLGFLMSSLGAGALIAAIYMAGRNSIIGLARIISIFSFLMGLSVMAIFFSDKLFPSLVILFISGLSMIMSTAAVNTMLQSILDEDKRGRVMSFYAMALMGTMPIGNLLAGIVANKIGIPYTLLLEGLITIAAVAWFEINRKTLRKYIRPIYIKKGLLPEFQN